MVAFLLIVIGLILIFINFKAIKNEKCSFSKTLKGSIENIDEYKEEIGLIRKEFAETLIDIQKEMVDLKKELNVLRDMYENNIEEKDLDKKNYIVDYSKGQNNVLLKSKYIKNKNTESISGEIITKRIISKEDTNKLEENLKKTKSSLIKDNNIQDNNSIKVKEVSRLLEEGHTIEDICERLNMGKGEVILIKELYLK